jgi:hypothetical protein
MSIPTEIPARPMNNPLTPHDYAALERVGQLLPAYGDSVARAAAVGLPVEHHVAAHEGFTTAHAKILELYPNPNAPLQHE